MLEPLPSAVTSVLVLPAKILPRTRHRRLFTRSACVLCQAFKFNLHKELSIDLLSVFRL
jgi:hypothetical protein